MNKQCILISLLLFLISCVKDTTSRNDIIMFTALINSSDFTKNEFVGDGTTKYKIELRALNGINITDGKTATISVTDGWLSAVNNLGNGSSSSIISTIVNGGRTTFYYVAGNEARSNALLTVTIEGLTQSFNFSILPSEPDKIQLSVSQPNPTINDNVDVTAFLVKNNPNSNLTSKGLKVFFTVTKTNAADQISANASVPGYSTSTIDGNGFIVCKTLVTTNRKPGTLTITATYTKTDNSVVTESTNLTYLP